MPECQDVRKKPLNRLNWWRLPVDEAAAFLRANYSYLHLESYFSTELTGTHIVCSQLHFIPGIYPHIYFYRIRQLISSYIKLYLITDNKANSQTNRSQIFQL